MRIVFMGTPDFAVPSLEVLADEYDIAAVVTQPDQRRGRGQKYSYSPVKAKALEYDLPLLQPKRIGDGKVIDQLKTLEADLFVVVAFGQILPARVLNVPRLGCVNLHASLLPKFRGAAPINAAITAGETVSGVTTMYMDVELDAGDIILQAEEPIRPEDTAGMLHDRLMVLGAGLLKETVRQIDAGTAPRIPQEHSAATYAPKLTKEDGYLDFARPAVELDRLVRGMNPWPGAHTVVKAESCKVWRSEPRPEGGSPGRILALADEGLLVGCGQGSLLLKELQRPNSKRVSGRDFANGLRLAVGDLID